MIAKKGEKKKGGVEREREREREREKERERGRDTKEINLSISFCGRIYFRFPTLCLPYIFIFKLSVPLQKMDHTVTASSHFLNQFFFETRRKRRRLLRRRTSRVRVIPTPDRITTCQLQDSYAIHLRF